MLHSIIIDYQARIITDGLAGYKAVTHMIPILTTGSCDL